MSMSINRGKKEKKKKDPSHFPLDKDTVAVVDDSPSCSTSALSAKRFSAACAILPLQKQRVRGQCDRSRRGGAHRQQRTPIR